MDLISGLFRDIVVVLMLFVLGKKVEHRACSIFYRRPLRTYLRVLAIQYFLFSWICLGLWYVAVVHGRGRYPSGPYMDAFCLQPEPSPRNTTSWFSDLWNMSRTNSTINPSRDMGTVITGHLAIEEAGMGLRQGMERLSDVPLGVVEVHELLKSLDWVTDIVSDLVPQLNAFSYVLCMEKVRMTHTFRTFVEAYAMTITSTGYEDLTLPSIFLFTGFHLMRIIGQHFLWSWLPEPKLYSIQVRVEIQYRKAQLIDELEATLERIDANFPASQSFQDSSSQRQCLETAINKLTIHQQSVRRVIDGSNPSFWRWTRESEETVKLGRYYRMGESVLSHLFAVMQTINEYKMYSRSLRGGLQVLRQSFERLPLARNLLAVPPPLLTQVRKISLLARGQSSRTDEGGDSRDITHIVSRYGASLYDLNPIDKARLSSLRSEVAQVCKAGNYMKMGCDDLFSICTIYHLGVIRSVLGNDLLSDYPTSWAVVREKAMHRWEQRTRT